MSRPSRRGLSDAAAGCCLLWPKPLTCMNVTLVGPTRPLRVGRGPPAPRSLGPEAQADQGKGRPVSG